MRSRQKFGAGATSGAREATPRGFRWRGEDERRREAMTLRHAVSATRGHLAEDGAALRRAARPLRPWRRRLAPDFELARATMKASAPGVPSSMTTPPAGTTRTSKASTSARRRSDSLGEERELRHIGAATSRAPRARLVHILEAERRMSTALLRSAAISSDDSGEVAPLAAAGAHRVVVETVSSRRRHRRWRRSSCGVDPRPPTRRTPRWRRQEPHRSRARRTPRAPRARLATIELGESSETKSSAVGSSARPATPRRPTECGLFLAASLSVSARSIGVSPA